MIKDFKKSQFWINAKRNSNILREMVVRNVKNQYRSSVLGIFWTILNPLLNMIVLSIIFSHIFNRSEDIINYPVYLLIGNILFNFVRASTEQGLTSIVYNSDLLKKVKISYSVFPISNTLSSLVNFAFSLIALFVVMIILKQPMYPTMILLFVLMPSVILFAMGMGMALSAMFVYFRDVKHLYTIFLTIWMYATPIFYSINGMGRRVQTVIKLNPLYHFLTYFRQIVQVGTVPSALTHLICYGAGIAMFLFGWGIFHATKKKFILFI